MIMSQPSDKASWTAQRIASASAGEYFLEHILRTSPLWSRAITARVVELSEMAASEFILIQSEDGGD